MNLAGLKTQKTRSDETYELRLKATDALGAFVTKAQKLSAAKPDEPPQITSVSIPSRIGAHTYITIGATATDPDGDDNKIDWSVYRSGSRMTGLPSYSRKNTPSINDRFRVDNRVPRTNTFTVNVTATDEDGLQANANRSVSMSRDPLIFDLNGDNKVEIVGATEVKGGVQILPVFGQSKFYKQQKVQIDLWLQMRIRGRVSTMLLWVKSLS